MADEIMNKTMTEIENKIVLDIMNDQIDTKMNEIGILMNGIGFGTENVCAIGIQKGKGRGTKNVNGIEKEVAKEIEKETGITLPETGWTENVNKIAWIENGFEPEIVIGSGKWIVGMAGHLLPHHPYCLGPLLIEIGKD